MTGEVFISPIFLQRGFSLMTGYNIGEYIRNRRLYQAAIDLRSTKDPVIDIAYRYCYETPESFTKAFSRFHGATPSQIRAGAPFTTFLPVKINITIQGGDKMNYKIQSMKNFKVIGFQKNFDSETFLSLPCLRFLYGSYLSSARSSLYFPYTNLPMFRNSAKAFSRVWESVS